VTFADPRKKTLALNSKLRIMANSNHSRHIHVQREMRSSVAGPKSSEATVFLHCTYYLIEVFAECV
jgi:hypothetical protein